MQEAVVLGVQVLVNSEVLADVLTGTVTRLDVVVRAVLEVEVCADLD